MSQNECRHASIGDNGICNGCGARAAISFEKMDRPGPVRFGSNESDQVHKLIVERYLVALGMAIDRHLIDSRAAFDNAAAAFAVTWQAFHTVDSCACSTCQCVREIIKHGAALGIGGLE